MIGMIITIDALRAVLHCLGRVRQQLLLGFHGDFEEEWWDLLGRSGQPAIGKNLYSRSFTSRWTLSHVR